MAVRQFVRSRVLILFLILCSFIAGCSTSANSRYFGQTAPPKNNVLRYVTGGEPESLDPPITNSQPDARILIALYDGLVEYDPKTMEPIPGIAESWETGKDGTEYLLHLRHNAMFSNGDPITANDFVYSLRRGFSPELASRNASLGYYIKYSEAYNSGQSFIKDPNGQFLIKKDFVEANPNQPQEPVHDTLGGDSEFHRYLDAAE